MGCIGQTPTCCLLIINPDMTSTAGPTVWNGPEARETFLLRRQALPSLVDVFYNSIVTREHNVRLPYSLSAQHNRDYCTISIAEACKTSRRTHPDTRHSVSSLFRGASPPMFNVDFSHISYRDCTGMHWWSGYPSQ